MARKRRHLMGEVNLLGLDSFGQNPGISPITGALIGGGVAGGTSILLGHMKAGTMAADREFWGLLAGLGAAGALWLSGPSRARHASWGALVGAFLAEGLPWLEKKLLGTVQLPAATAQTATAVAAAAGTPGMQGLGIAKIHALNGLGIPKVQALNGLGIPQIAAQPQSRGTIPGVHGLGMRRQAGGQFLNSPAFAGAQLGAANPPVSLLGAPSGMGQQVSLLGGPAIHGLSSAYGATLLGGGRS